MCVLWQVVWVTEVKPRHLRQVNMAPRWFFDGSAVIDVNINQVSVFVFLISNIPQ